MLPQIKLMDKGHATGEAGLGVLGVDVLVELLKVGNLLAALLAGSVVFLAVCSCCSWRHRLARRYRYPYALLFGSATFFRRPAV
jgi:hypothetical protein